MDVDLGQRIATWRKAKKLTQQDLAEVCDISVAAVSYWESGDTAPSQKHLNQIVELFDVSMERFYGSLPKLAKAS